MMSEHVQCTKSELDLFSMPGMVGTFDESVWVKYTPVAGMGPLDNTIRFDISNPVNSYIDLAECYMRVVYRVKRADGNDTIVDNVVDNNNRITNRRDIVAPINNSFHSLFREVRVIAGANQVELSDSLGNYPYRAYIENILSCDKSQLDTTLTTEGFKKDTVDRFNTVLRDRANGNTGFIDRYNMIVPTNPVEHVARLHSDLFLQHRYLLDGVPLKLELIRTPPEFFFMHEDNADNRRYRAHIDVIEFYARQVTIAPSIREQHIQALSRGGTARYPICQVRCTAHDIPQGVRSFHTEHLVSGDIPKRMVLGMVDNRAYAGDVERNPLEFKHNHLTQMTIKVNGREVNKKSYAMDFGDNSGQLAETYLDLFRHTGGVNRNSSHTITPREFKAGYTLFVCDLTPDLGADESHVYRKYQGKVGLELNFSQPTADPVTLICYQEFDSIIHIDRFRNVSMT